MDEPIRLLYVDDSPLDRDLVRDALEQEHGGFQVIEASSRTEFEKRLLEGGYSIVLSDFNILGFEGLQVIDAVHQRYPDVPVIIVTGTGSEEIAVAALKRGAADYVLKTAHHIQRLPMTISAVLDRWRMMAERARADEQLRAQAEQITQIMHSVPDGVLLLDQTRRVLMANPVGETYLTALAGVRTDAILTALGDRSLADLLTSPAPGHWHEVQQGKRTFETIATPLTNEGPATGGWVLIVREVTEQRLVQRQLSSQERLAAVGQLAAGISHDFKNLMGVIVLYVELLANSPGLSELDRNRLAKISQQVDQATQLIRQILDFSGHSILDLQPLNLRQLLVDEIDLLKRVLPESIDVSMTFTKEECLVNADPTRLRQILLNLAVNARDAMPSGGRLRFDLAYIHVGQASECPLPQMKLGGYFRLKVMDSGMGIAPSNLDHVFEPFFTTKAAGLGAGLGLAQVHGIVTQHGGYIGATSQVGIGTTFSIYLPALTVTLSHEQPTPVSETEIAQGNGELLMVVEDNQPLRLALASFLQMWNYRTIEAANGEDAMVRLAQSNEPVSLILSDAVMPKLGGAALLRTLRQQGYRIPMIILTGHPLESIEWESLHAQGLFALLIKPPDLPLLAQTIKAALATVNH
jgi:signal transduction histidine kinase